MNDGAYRLTVAAQPTVNPDVLQISVGDADGGAATLFGIDGQRRDEPSGVAVIELANDLVIDVER